MVQAAPVQHVVPTKFGGITKLGATKFGGIIKLGIMKFGGITKLGITRLGGITKFGVIDVSLIVIVAEVALIVPDVETVLMLTLNVSGPSVVKSFANVKENDPKLLVIATEPPALTALAGELKSASFTVPDNPRIVQYSVPVPKFCVVTVSVTDEPSFTDVVLGLIVTIKDPLCSPKPLAAMPPKLPIIGIFNPKQISSVKQERCM
mgnify:CR=1 FL=1